MCDMCMRESDDIFEDILIQHACTETNHKLELHYARAVSRVIKSSSVWALLLLCSGLIAMTDAHPAHSATKVNNGEHGYYHTRAAIMSSLSNLGVTYIDCMLMHSAMSDKTRRLESWRALVEAKEEGKVHSIGVSN